MKKIFLTLVLVASSSVATMASEFRSGYSTSGMTVLIKEVATSVGDVNRFGLILAQDRDQKLIGSFYKIVKLNDIWAWYPLMVSQKSPGIYLLQKWSDPTYASKFIGNELELTYTTYGQTIRCIARMQLAQDSRAQWNDLVNLPQLVKGTKDDDYTVTATDDQTWMLVPRYTSKTSYHNNSRIVETPDTTGYRLGSSYSVEDSFAGIGLAREMQIRGEDIPLVNPRLTGLVASVTSSNWSGSQMIFMRVTPEKVSCDNIAIRMSAR